MAGASYFNDPTLTMKAGRKPRCFSHGSMSVAIRKGSNVPASLTPDISCIHGFIITAWTAGPLSAMSEGADVGTDGGSRSVGDQTFYALSGLARNTVDIADEK
jgi:hypothetical protein